jgi:hypothetical protein
MDDKWIDILSSLPPRPARSRLEPYCDLIEELRRRGRTYREITSVLMEKCQVRASRSNIHHFVSLRAQRARFSEHHVASPPDPHRRASVQGVEAKIDERRTPATDEVRQRIAALKQR